MILGPYIATDVYLYMYREELLVVSFLRRA